MREFSVPGIVTIPDSANLTDMVYDNAEKHPRSVAIGRPDGSTWRDVTAAEFARDVTALAKGLVASGVEPGDRVALMSRTRYEWTLADYAIWTAGGVTVPIYETSSAEQVHWICSDSGAVAAIVESPGHQSTVEQVRPHLPALRDVWQIDAGAVQSLSALGEPVGHDTIAERRAGVVADDLATIIYTSGTTGRPKGCEITHRNLLFEVLAISPGLRALFNPQGSTLLFLPLAHVFARAIQCGAVYNRSRLGHTADAKNLVADLATFAPTFLLSVPHVFYKVYNGARQKAHADGKGKIFEYAERVAVAYSESVDRGGPGLMLRLRHRVMDRLVYSKLRAALGGRCEQAISGGAPLGDRLAHFYRGIGLVVYEGYGLTETTAGVSVNMEGALKIGTVGQPVPGMSVRIAEDGEILLKGGVVFRGYRNNPEATGEALVDGWFHTGDIGELDEDGFLSVTGRKKEILVTSSGKNVAPAVLEDRLRAHRLISQAMVVGDRRPFVACLVTIDADFLPAWLAEHAKPAGTAVADLRDDPALRAEIQAAVDTANEAVSQAESIRKFRILGSDFSEETGELTPSMKVRRSVILENHAAEVDALYDASRT